MVGEALAALQEVDAVCAIVETADRRPSSSAAIKHRRRHEYVIDELKAVEKPAVLALNKVDIAAATRACMLPMLEALHEGARLARGGADLGQVRRRRRRARRASSPACCPSGERLFPEEMLTDRAERWLGAEFVREQVFLLTRQEVPYSVAGHHRHLGGARAKDVMVEATIHVDKEAHKRIVVGEGGRMIREIGTRARQEISNLLAVPVHLKLFVRVDEGWTDNARQLRELGYGERMSARRVASRAGRQRCVAARRHRRPAQRRQVDAVQPHRAAATTPSSRTSRA